MSITPDLPYIKNYFLRVALANRISEFCVSETNDTRHTPFEYISLPFYLYIPIISPYCLRSLPSPSASLFISDVLSVLLKRIYLYILYLYIIYIYIFLPTFRRSYNSNVLQEIIISDILQELKKLSPTY